MKDGVHLRYTSDMDFGALWLGYQMPISSGLPLGSAANSCWNPAACTQMVASVMARIVKAENTANFKFFIDEFQIQPGLVNCENCAEKQMFDDMETWRDGDHQPHS